MAEQRQEGGVILFPSDTGGNKGEIRNRAMSGLGACWAALGQENMGRQGGRGRRAP